MPGIEKYPIFRNLSIADLQQRMAPLISIDEKFELLYHYMLSYGMEGSQANCSFEELLHAAKEELVKASLNAKDEYTRNRPNLAHPDHTVIDPYHDDENDNDTVNLRYFLRCPADYIRQVAEQLPGMMEDVPNLTEEEQAVVDAWKNNLSRLSYDLRDIDEEFKTYEKDAVPGDILRRVGTKVYERDDITPQDILARNKGGFWENFRGTTSQEYKDFERTYLAFNNSDDPGWKDKEALRQASMAYIRHKFPSLEEGKLPTPEQVAALKSSTARGRVHLCVAMVQELKLQDRIDEMTEYWSDNTIDHNEPGFANLIEFQDQVAQDLNESEHSLSDEDEPEENNERHIEDDFSIVESEVSDNSI